MIRLSSLIHHRLLFQCVHHSWVEGVVQWISILDRFNLNRFEIAHFDEVLWFEDTCMWIILSFVELNVFISETPTRDELLVLILFKGMKAWFVFLSAHPILSLATAKHNALDLVIRNFRRLLNSAICLKYCLQWVTCHLSSLRLRFLNAINKTIVDCMLLKRVNCRWWFLMYFGLGSTVVLFPTELTYALIEVPAHVNIINGIIDIIADSGVLQDTFPTRTIDTRSLIIIDTFGLLAIREKWHWLSFEHNSFFNLTFI